MVKVGDRVVTSADVEALPLGATFGLRNEDTLHYTRVLAGFRTHIFHTNFPTEVIDYMGANDVYYVKSLPPYEGKHRA